jgi:hypothetical protein
MDQIYLFCYLVIIVFGIISPLQYFVVTEFQAKRMGIWGIPSRLIFFIVWKVRQMISQLVEQ